MPFEIPLGPPVQEDFVIKSIKKSVIALLLLFPVLLFAGGQKEIEVGEAASSMAVLGETESSVSFQQADGTVVELPKNPERAMVALNSIMDVWYMAGGTSVARLKGSINVPDEAKDLPVLGSISTLNLELAVELEPDFIICSETAYQDGLRDHFSQEGIPVVTISYQTYDDFRVMMDLFTRLTGRRDIYEDMMIPLEKQVQSVLNQVPEESPSVCILFASTRYVKVETQNTITGYFCEKLGADNIYKEEIIEGATRVDLSLEYILEQDPDIIFVTTMGDVEKCRARIDQEVVSSDIWGDLTAVKEGRFYYLDKSYSVYKPNRFYPEAYKIMAEFLYPDQAFTLDTATR